MHDNLFSEGVQLFKCGFVTAKKAAKARLAEMKRLRIASNFIQETVALAEETSTQDPQSRANTIGPIVRSAVLRKGVYTQG
mmetsp:Transcript_8633/g.14852  ORF Transcript_8633/g.14852 Transcript_8633/m.14852 type:complete len:81 (-) Transcript_8633:217-459(-)